MANRFPLIVNPDSKEIQELAQNDNLDLTGSGIYAGGSLGQNGQVLATNGTTVEWRSISASGGGGGGGVELDTTYVIETQDLVDGTNLNLIAGGTGVGTISIKLEDNNQIKFDAASNLSLQASIKDSSITNTQLQNSYLNIEIDGVSTPYSLGGTVTIPQYGDVDLNSIQSIQNKTFTNCSLSGSVNTFQSIPNSALQNNIITINGTDVALGGSISIAGTGGGGGTYEISAEDWSDQQGNNDPDRKAIRLTDTSNSTTDNVLLVAGDRIQLTRSGDEITITNTEVNTDTDTNTTYNIITDTLVSNGNDIGARLKLNDSDGNYELVNLRDGTGVKVTSTGANDISFSLGQDVSTTSNVEFNNLTLGGSLTVNGALSYINATNLKITDKTVTIADGSTNSAQSQGAGILVGTSNINLTYQDSSSAWTSTAHFDVAPTKTYKIGGTEVLTATRLFGKTIPTGDFIGTTDQQSLSNKTINSPVISEIINTGTVYFPAPTVFDTLVGRNTNDTLQNKTINGSQNTLSNIGNSSLTYSNITINGNSVSLGGTINVTATDPYNDEKAQDAVAGSLTNGSHSGISFDYDDTTGKINATVTGGGGAGTDTLADVTGRGATTNDNITLGDASNQPEFNLSLGVSSGSTNYLKIFGGSNEVYLRNTDGSGGGGSINIQARTGVALWQDTGNLGLYIDSDCAANLYYQTALKLKTTTAGVDVYGALTSDSFVKVGGTSSEYLMADGSVSSSAGNFSGNFTGNITAGLVTSDSFVKNGGTSSQYLMADGSVSSSPITITSSTGNFSGTFTGNLDAGAVTSDSFVKNGGTSSQYLMADGSVNSSLTMGGSMTSSIIPDTNETYDLGSAEYKIRHLFLSDNTIYSDSGIMRIAQHQVGGVAQAPTQLISIAKIKEIMTASADFGTFKSNIEALVDD